MIVFKLQQDPAVPLPRTLHRCHWLWVVWLTISWWQNTGHTLSSSDQSRGPCGRLKPQFSHMEKVNGPFLWARSTFLCALQRDPLWSWADLTFALVRVIMAWPVRVVVQVQCVRGQQLRQLLVVVKVQGKVRGDDGLSDYLQHLLVLAGIQVGENIVPFQLWETKRSIKKQKLHLWGVQLN